ncbi:hypothetical protein [Dyella tabacisoli]|uniref:hypothetical protein n=1 Tax=Dyella tabacisoli TaxID=2282381 RepID=UPI0013B3E7D2|nr:hypothetical protein [Dyella tabacisoli]
MTIASCFVGVEDERPEQKIRSQETLAPSLSVARLDEINGYEGDNAENDSANKVCVLMHSMTPNA